MASAQKLELLVEDAVWAEGPRWRDNSLFYSDIGANSVHRLHADGRLETVVSDIPGASGLGWTKQGEMLVASILDSAIYAVGNDGSKRVVCGPESHGTRGTNDMASAAGRSYVTCAGRDTAPDDTIEQISQPCGKILLFDHATGDCRVVGDGYRMPNGIAFTPDARRIVMSDLFTSRLLEFDVEADGSLSNERLFAQLHAPCDGLCMDAQGAVWAATHRDFSRYDASGTLTDSIPVNDWTCIATALGGDDGRDLYLLVARSERPHDIFEGKSQSRILRTRVDVPAAPALP